MKRGTQLACGHLLHVQNLELLYIGYRPRDSLNTARDLNVILKSFVFQQAQEIYVFQCAKGQILAEHP